MNLAEQIANVIRTVNSSGEEHGVRLERTFATTPSDLWDAVTSPERLPRWFEPVEGDLVRGGRYRLADSGTTGTIHRCDQPHALRVTWESGADKSSVELTPTPDGSGTRLTLRHVVPDNDHWDTYGPSAVARWVAAGKPPYSFEPNAAAARRPEILGAAPSPKESVPTA